MSTRALLKSKFEAIARRGACVRTYEMPVTIDLGLWQFRRGRRIAWCCCFPEDQHHSHVITWHHCRGEENEIVFYDAGGYRVYRVAPYDAWDDYYTPGEVNHLASEWQRWQTYLADKHNARGMNAWLSRQWKTPSG